jgi:hypothetical protein
MRADRKRNLEKFVGSRVGGVPLFLRAEERVNWIDVKWGRAGKV